MSLDTTRRAALVATLAAFASAVATLLPWAEWIDMGPDTEAAWVAALVALIAGLAGLFRADPAQRG